MDMRLLPRMYKDRVMVRAIRNRKLSKDQDKVKGMPLRWDTPCTQTVAT